MRRGRGVAAWHVGVGCRSGFAASGPRLYVVPGAPVFLAGVVPNVIHERRHAHSVELGQREQVFGARQGVAAFPLGNRLAAHRKLAREFLLAQAVGAAEAVQALGKLSVHGSLPVKRCDQAMRRGCRLPHSLCAAPVRATMFALQLCNLRLRGGETSGVAVKHPALC